MIIQTSLASTKLSKYMLRHERRKQDYVLRKDLKDQYITYLVAVELCYAAQLVILHRVPHIRGKLYHHYWKRITHVQTTNQFSLFTFKCRYDVLVTFKFALMCYNLTDIFVRPSARFFVREKTFKTTVVI